MTDDMSAYKEVFLSESAEYVQSIVDGLLELEHDPGADEPVETVFRGAHSLKGMAAAMGYDATAELTHKMESLMDVVRKRERAADSELIDLMLRSVDAVKVLIGDESEGRAATDISSLVAELVAMTAGTSIAAETESEAGVVAPVLAAETGRLLRVTVSVDEASALKSVRAYMVLKRLAHIGQVVDTVPSARDIEDERFERTFEVLLRTDAEVAEVIDAAMHVSEIADAKAEEEEASEEPAEEDADKVPVNRRAASRTVPKLGEAQTVRVTIGHLDNLVNLVGELVILRSRLDRISAESQSRSLVEVVEELYRVSSELQHEVMQTRMVPVGNIFNRFPRMVRDLARDLGKDVAFEMQGLDIELDRTVLDEIGDPVVHLLRNAIDHGVETPEQRQAAGKPVRATVTLVASRDRDQVRVAVSDDGRGMDVERIWVKAVEAGLVRESERESYSAREIVMLTCTPGFSTIDRATQVSGRGVGMDVVKGKIEYLGGSLLIASETGKGSEFSLVLPLTLAIIQGLLIGDGDEVFAVGLAAVNEILGPDDVRTDTVDGAPVAVLREGEVVPLHRLSAMLGRGGDPYRQPGPGEHIVVMSVGGEQRALVVERLVGRQEIVVKPLSRLFRDARGLGGATLLGDGGVALILDPRTLFPSREAR